MAVDVVHDGGAGVHEKAVAEPLEALVVHAGVAGHVEAGSDTNTPEDLAAADGEHSFAEAGRCAEGVVAAAESVAGHTKSCSALE